ncbi:MAG: hypothetical protein K2N08_06585 [Muribaculaceae bacterium]|nr:hypothetical protein [Muribaculaceae bacterium]MDE7369423.1 hypothetical protein [Muribaculaceae bacterium]
MKKIKYLYLLLLAVMSCSVMTSCSNDDDDNYGVAPAVQFVEPENGFSVEINETLAPEIKVTGTDPLTYSWTVDGKEVATDRAYVFRKNAEGVYNLSVTAKNNKGVATAETQVLVVKPGTDIAVAIDRTAGEELMRYNPTVIKANVHSLHNVDYLWTVESKDSTWTSTDKDLDFYTPFTGTHKVSLTVSNILGQATDEFTVDVKYGPIDVAIVLPEAEEAKVECGEILKLVSTVAGDSVASYKWLVDGKQESDSATLDFVKLEPGDYEVSLIVANPSGKEFEAKQTVNVYNAGFRFGLRLAGIETEIGEGETITLNAVCDWENAKYEWSVDGKVVSTDKDYTFPGSTEIGKVFKINLVISRGDEKYPFEKTIKITERYASGAFLLFEGNMTSENGAISFISDGGTVYNKLFRENNGGAQLGNVSQGLFLRDRKIYIVAQNGQNTAYGVPNGGGLVTIMDGRTMEKIDSYDRDFFERKIAWPREIYVPNERYAILKSSNSADAVNGSTNGVLDMVNRTYEQMIFPEGGGKSVNAYVVRKGKAYAAIKQDIYIVDVANHKIGEKVLTLDFNIAELLPSRDGSVWAISDLSDNQKTIAKLTSDMKLVAQKSARIVQGESSAMSPHAVSVGSDYIFFGTSGSPVVKYHFETNTATTMNSVSFYNAFAYNEAKGTLYIGQIDEYDFSGGVLEQINKYSVSGASWPAGIWFTYNFDEW